MEETTLPDTHPVLVDRERAPNYSITNSIPWVSGSLWYEPESSYIMYLIGCLFEGVFPLPGRFPECTGPDSLGCERYPLCGG
jgi:hypothetical protein